MSPKGCDAPEPREGAHRAGRPPPGFLWWSEKQSDRLSAHRPTPPTSSCTRRGGCFAPWRVDGSEWCGKARNREDTRARHGPERVMACVYAPPVEKSRALPTTRSGGTLSHSPDPLPGVRTPGNEHCRIPRNLYPFRGVGTPGRAGPPPPSGPPSLSIHLRGRYSPQR